MLTVVVIFYLCLSLLVGVFLSRRVKKTSDFLIAGRKLGLLLTTACALPKFHTWANWHPAVYR
jgi:Na+/proline symporter